MDKTLFLIQEQTPRYGVNRYMEPDARYTLVGIAVIALVALSTAFAVWLYRAGHQESTDYYTIYFKGVSVAGLQIDSWVTMRGIKVGRVDDIEISPRDVELVKVDVELRSSAPVKTDTRAIVQQSIITGQSTIDLTGTSQVAPFLIDQPLLPGERYPVIQQGESQLQVVVKTVPEVLSNANALAQKLSRLSDDVSAVLSDSNRRAFEEVLTNLAATAANLSQGTRNLDQTMAELSKAVAAIRKISEIMQSQGGPVLQAVKTAAEQIGRDASSISYDINRMADGVSGAATRLQNPREAVFGPSPRLLGPAEKEVRK